MKPIVILVNPKYSGNVGAISRCMANFNVEELRIVGEKDIINEEAKIRAVHSKYILENAKFYNNLSEAIKDIDYTVATSGAISGDKNLKRIPITPKELAVKHLKLNGKLGLVFGREDYGLYNDELKLCDLFVSVPTSENYPIMNLSHAVSVILYELYCANLENTKEKYSTVNINSASKLEKDILLKLFSNFVNNNNTIPEYRKELCITIFKRIISRAFINGKEANTLMCVFKNNNKNNKNKNNNNNKIDNNSK